MLPAALRRVTDGVTPYFCLLLAIVTLGPHQFGFHLAELNAPQDVITCHQRGIVPNANKIPGMTLPQCIPMTEAQFATVSSVFTVGGLIGALVAGPFCSREGRLLAMRLTAVVFLLGSITETFAPSVAVLAIGRVLNGLSAGASTVIVPLYISEVAPVQSRGFFGAFTQITVNIGILFTQTLGFFLSHGSAWRYILGTGIVLAFIQFVGLLGVPESPAWLAARGGDGEEGKTLQAKRILQRIRGTTVNLDDEVAHWPSAAGSAEEQALLAGAATNTTDTHLSAAEQYDVDADEGIVTVAPPSPRGPTPLGGGANKTKAKAPVGFFELLVDSYYRPALIAVIGIMFAQQVCGINSVIMYSVSLLNGMLPLNSALLTIIISCVNLVTTMLSAPLPDRLGRKTCLLISVIGQGISSLVLAFSIVYGVKILSAFSVLTFVAFFAVGLGPVPFILASELVGQEAVGATQSWALGANYVATFLVAQFFPLVNTALNNRFGGAGWVYFLFAMFAFLSTIFFWFYVPETNGKKDADEVWGRTSRID
ncbi:Bifunctional purine biosynthesis protein PurH [Sporothrix stenoceras]|uniref:Bifunctional purine biosynthesis protein PurH n=1 Tax=Sporothrix stenoceras TaxID=5173 RepID=A0ABR3Z1R7_9PEZI